ncbi:MAG: isoamylase early set domain-containing protein [Spirochaetales bacterium]|nr:isoamylase early set domain-containing protein [Spirochaetales bacterium]
MKPLRSKGVYLSEEKTMRCEEFSKEMARWLETVWDIETPAGGEVPAELTRHAEACPACMKRLKTAKSLVSARHSLAEPSPFLANAVQERLTGVKPAARKHPVAYTALAAALAVALIAVGLMGGLFRSGSGNTKEMIVRFSLEAPGARQVYVVGDWNDWNAGADPLFDTDSDGVWETEINLEPGKEYRYQFFIDDSEWVADPKAPLKIDDGFGGENSILRI